MGIQQVIKLTGRSLPVPRRDAVFEILVENLSDGIALQRAVNAGTNQFGVLTLEFTGLETKGAGDGLA